MLNELVATATPAGAPADQAVALKFSSATADYTGEIFGLKHKPELAIDNNQFTGENGGAVLRRGSRVVY